MLKVFDAAMDRLMTWTTNWSAKRTEREQLFVVCLLFLLPVLACLIPDHSNRIGLVSVSILPGFFFFGASTMAFRRQHDKEFLLRNSTSREQLHGMTGRDFELLCSALLSAEGFEVDHVGKYGEPDGGVDLIARRDGKTWIGQCKKYEHESIGVGLIRQLRGVRETSKADGVMFFTALDFTSHAWKEFGEDSTTKLVDGGELLRRLEAFRATYPATDDGEKSAVHEFMKKIAKFMDANEAYIFVPRCEKCDQRMTLCYSKKNDQRFWRCPGYHTGECQSGRPLKPEYVPILDPERGRA